jgi:hypothetical protein
MEEAIKGSLTKFERQQMLQHRISWSTASSGWR